MKETPFRLHFFKSVVELVEGCEELCTMCLLLYSRLLQETFGVCCFFGGDNRMMRYGFIRTKSFMNLSSALNKILTSTANAQSLYFISDHRST